MARMRTLKPGFFSDDQLAEVNPLGRLLFAGLWCIADRSGRLEDRPKRIKAEVLPYDNANVDKLLTELHARGFIERYEIDGHRFIQVSNFVKHQNPHIKEPESTIPAPCEHSADTVPSTVQEQFSPGSNFNSPSNRNGIQEQEQEQEQGTRAKTGAPPGNARVAAVIEAFRDFSGESEPPMTARDFAAIKHSTAPPQVIAETYLAVAGSEWGDDFQRKRLSVHEACDWVPAYVLWRDEHGIEPMVAHYRDVAN